MSLLAYLLAPCLLALVSACLGGPVRRRPVAFAQFLALIALGGAGFALALGMRETATSISWPWVPALQVDFALRLDSFRALFLALICGTAASIFLFTGILYRDAERLPGLLAALLLFSATMIGIVLADDLLILFLFWEGTSLLSFLLIGWYHQKEGVRWNATQALLVTALGGLALLAGLILLREAAGTTSLSAISTLDLSSHPLAPALVILIGLGALTKSAQFPFHFWLPNAMAGPTPVSAFLHSATMVKAGVFLLAVLAPTLSDHPLWTPLFLSCGLLTVAAALIRAWKETDLKAILAATTLAALGHLTILAAIGTPAALQAFIIFLLAHALYKAPLFLACGVFEKAYETRDVTRLRGAGFLIPVTGSAVALSLASLLGVPFLPGFVGKEYLLKNAWAINPWLAVLAAASFMAVIALAVRAFAPLFSRGDIHLPRHRPSRALQLTPWISTILALILTAGFPWISRHLVSPAAASLGAIDLGATNPQPLLLWPGWSPILGLSAAALVLGILLGRRANPTPAPPTQPPLLDALYRTIFEALGRTAKGIASFLQDHPLRTHLGVVVLVSGLVVASQFLHVGLPLPTFTLDGPSVIPAILAALIAGTAVTAAAARTRLELLAMLGLLGLLIALLYSYFSAPDLALTQLLTETVLLVFLVAVLRHFPRSSSPAARKAPAFALPVALLGGLVTTALVLKAKALELTPPVSSFFSERSLTDAFGANVVNVILVDFRALDTLGEITVLAIAALGASALLRRKAFRVSFHPTHSALLRTALPLLLTALLVFSLLILVRGHNNPGGGFIAALVTATAFGFLALCGASTRLARLDLVLAFGGVAIAALAGCLPLASGRPFLTGLWIHPELPSGQPLTHLGTPLLFDLGVFFAVFGFALAFLRRFLPSPRPPLSWN